jgi:hypothetical protein
VTPMVSRYSTVPFCCVLARSVHYFPGRRWKPPPGIPHRVTDMASRGAKTTVLTDALDRYVHILHQGSPPADAQWEIRIEIAERVLNTVNAITEGEVRGFFRTGSGYASCCPNATAAWVA